MLADENAALATDFGVRQAPTLVVVTDEGVEKYAGVGNIRRYIDSVK